MFVAGQVPRGPDGRPTDERSPGALLAVALENLRQTLRHHGLASEDLVLVQTHLAPEVAPDDPEILALHREHLSGASMTLSPVSGLNDPGYLVELHAYALAVEKETRMNLRPRSPIEVALGASTAVRAGGLVFVSGQLPFDLDGMLAHPGDVVGQFTVVMQRIADAIQPFGASLDDVVSTMTWITEPLPEQSFTAFCDAHRRAFEPGGPNLPSGTMVRVAALPLTGAMVQMNAIAVASRP